MSVALMISALVVAYGLGFWTGMKAIRNRDVRVKLAADVAENLLDDGLAAEIAKRLSREHAR